MTGASEGGEARRRTEREGDASDVSGAPPTNDEEADRAAANERYEALIESSTCNYGCRPEDRVDRPALFRKQDQDVDKINEHDVKQNQLEDCALMAALAGLARTPEGRAVIENAIKENKNERGEVVSYTVTLHKPPGRHGGPGPKTVTPVSVTGDAQVV